MLCSFNDIKDLVPNIENNDKWQLLMAAADEIIKTRSGNRIFAQGIYNETIHIKTTGWQTIYFKEFPVTEVTELILNGTDITAEFNIENAYVYAPNSKDKIGLSLFFAEGLKLTIIYKGGYTIIPAPIKLAFAVAVNLSALKIGQGIAQSESVGGVSINYQNSEDTFKFIDSLLRPYWFKSYC